MLEITNGKSIHSYRIKPDDPCVIQWRRNAHNVRWEFLMRSPNAESAKLSLLRLERDDTGLNIADTVYKQS